MPAGGWGEALSVRDPSPSCPRGGRPLPGRSGDNGTARPGALFPWRGAARAARGDSLPARTRASLSPARTPEVLPGGEGSGGGAAWGRGRSPRWSLLGWSRRERDGFGPEIVD